jgi:hypothetical protein
VIQDLIHRRYVAFAQRTTAECHLKTANDQIDSVPRDLRGTGGQRDQCIKEKLARTQPDPQEHALHE